MSSRSAPLSVPPSAPQFVEDFALALTQLGFNRMPARVFCLVLAAPEESLTARELAERLGVSPAAVSGAVRYLGRINLLRRFRRPGERVDRFGLGDEVWAPVFDAEIAAYGPLCELCARALDRGELSGLGAERVAETVAFLEFMTHEMSGLLERWRQTRDERRDRLAGGD
ncbi:MAG: GbsR/MarR family transcriptional regulator [Marmoricola sp.]